MYFRLFLVKVHNLIKTFNLHNELLWGAAHISRVQLLGMKILGMMKFLNIFLHQSMAKNVFCRLDVLIKRLFSEKLHFDLFFK